MPEQEQEQYICTACKHRAGSAIFGLFVRCPLCDGDSVVSAEIWDRFGPKPTTPPQEANREDSHSIPVET